MVHHGQGLALGFEARDDLPGIHAQFNYFEGDAAADWFLLLGHINHAASAFADLLEQFVPADTITGLFGRGNRDSYRWFQRRPGWMLAERRSFLVRLEQTFDQSAKRGVLAASFIQIA